MGIYMILNKVTNKIYIGQSIDIQARFKAHKNDLRKNKHCNKHLQSAWNKDGEKSFEFIILCECEENKLNELEQYYILSLDATNQEIGYNLAWGGSSNRTTEETRKLLSDLNKGEKHPKKREVYCVELNKIYPYARKVTEELGINHGDIIKCCNGKRLTCKGYHWMYYEDYLSGKEILEKKKQPKRNHKQKVYCIERKEIFESIAEAQRITGCDSRAIHSCCKGKQKSTKGYHWEYAI